MTSNRTKSISVRSYRLVAGGRSGEEVPFPSLEIWFSFPHLVLEVAQRLDLLEGRGVLGEVVDLVLDPLGVECSIRRRALHARGLRVNRDRHVDSVSSVSPGGIRCAFPGSPPAGRPILHMGTDIRKHHKG